jgi:hypothetical protein
MAYNYYPNNQYYMQDLQNMKDRIDNQMRQLQNQQPIQQPQIHQNFQLAPQNNNNELESKYADSFEEVKNTFVMKTGIFTKKDFSTIWIKDVSGNIRTFKTEEVVELDEKDREILDLQRQLNELRGEIENAKSVNTDIVRSVENKKPTRTSSNSKSNAK